MKERIEFEAQCKAALVRKSTTLTAIAEELGISLGYVSDIVKGNREGGAYKEKIAEILEIKLED